MEKEKKFERIVKIRRKLKILSSSGALEILIILNDRDGYTSFSEIYSEIMKFHGNVNPNQVWRPLVKLEKAKLVASKRELVINPQTGKAKVLFYKITPFGQKILMWVDKFPHFLFFCKCLYLCNHSYF